MYANLFNSYQIQLMVDIYFNFLFLSNNARNPVLVIYKDDLYK